MRIQEFQQKGCVEGIKVKTASIKKFYQKLGSEGKKVRQVVSQRTKFPEAFDMMDSQHHSKKLQSPAGFVAHLGECQLVVYPVMAERTMFPQAIFKSLKVQRFSFSFFLSNTFLHHLRIHQHLLDLIDDIWLLSMQKIMICFSLLEAEKNIIEIKGLGEIQKREFLLSMTLGLMTSV